MQVKEWKLGSYKNSTTTGEREKSPAVNCSLISEQNSTGRVVGFELHFLDTKVLQANMKRRLSALCLLH